MSLEIVVLAAGKGTRMSSNIPKVLHSLGGQPLLQHVLKCARSTGAAAISVVYGHGGDDVPEAISDPSIRWVLQERQLGTGHAVKLAMDQADGGAIVLVMYGDIPLIEPETLARLVAAARQDETLAILTIELDEPGAYGRIVRESGDGKTGDVKAIVESRDASEAHLGIREINTGFMAAPRNLLAGWLNRLDMNNSQGEYYLTDIAAMAVADGHHIATHSATDPWEVEGINSRVQLAAIERVLQIRRAERLMACGVTIADPARVDIRGGCITGRDCFFDINLVLEGNNTIGSNVRIGPNCVLKDAEIGDNVEIYPNSIIEASRIESNASVGPFARIRPGTVLGDGARIGNFVETKKTCIGEGSKVNHLSYIGDSDIGKNVNIGAGVITCNYDGVNKNRTIVGDGAFVGSDCQLVAPVEVGAGASIGAGTTLTRDAPAEQLTLSRSPLRTLRKWRRPVKKT